MVEVAAIILTGVAVGFIGSRLIIKSVWGHAYKAGVNEGRLHAWQDGFDKGYEVGSAK